MRLEAQPEKMPSKFSQPDVDDLLVRCHRRCCVCHRYCGVKIEMDHIVPSAADGPSDVANAIPVCFECHAEIHSYNDQHPRGRKFRPDELRKTQGAVAGNLFGQTGSTYNGFVGR